jgi:hypothetical protein
MLLRRQSPTYRPNERRCLLENVHAAVHQSYLGFSAIHTMHAWGSISFEETFSHQLFRYYPGQRQYPPPWSVQLPHKLG